MRKREKTLLNKIRNEREDISTNPEDIRRFLRGSRRKNFRSNIGQPTWNEKILGRTEITKTDLRSTRKSD